MKVRMRACMLFPIVTEPLGHNELSPHTHPLFGIYSMSQMSSFTACNIPIYCSIKRLHILVQKIGKYKYLEMDHLELGSI